MTTMRVLILSMLIIGLMTASSEAGWLVFSEPEFNGKILDIDTKQPIEGAVIVAEYKKENMGLGGGNISSVIDVREALTDKDGNFHFSSYSTVIQPFSWKISTVFIIFKPGYASVELALKDYFTGKETREQEFSAGPYPELRMLKLRLHGPGIVELPQLKTREQRMKAMPSPVTDIDYKHQKLLIRLLNEERKNLGLTGEYSIKE